MNRPSHEPICNPEAEEAVLGAILIRPQVLDEVSDGLDPDDFYRTANGNIYRVMLGLYNREEPVDYLTVSNRLGEVGWLEKVGGPVYLVSLSEKVGLAVNAKYYARIVREKAILRRLLDASQEIASACHGPVENVKEFVDAAEQRIFAIGQVRRQGMALSLKDLIPPERERIESLYYHPRTPGFSTGFIDLDRITGGFQAGDLIIIAARPSIGKTALGLNIAYNGATQAQAPVVIFSLEMSRRQLINRLIAMAGNLDSYRVRQGRLTPEEWKVFEKVSADLEELPIFINDETMITPMQVRSQARRLRAEHGIGLVIVDYLQLMKDPEFSSRSREQEVASISRNLKALAKELSIPVVGLCQLNREIEKRSNKRPHLADLRESGAIEQDADVVIFLHTEGENQETHVAGIELNVAKHRNGPTGRMNLVFLRNFQQFKNAEK